LAGDGDAARWPLARSDRLDAAPQFGIEGKMARNSTPARTVHRPAECLRL
jgi:hypothetical protein